MYGMSKETAEALASELNAKLEKDGTRWFERNKKVVRYIVCPFEHVFPNRPVRWGIVPRWVYPDEPDREMGGAFITRYEIERRLA